MDKAWLIFPHQLFLKAVSDSKNKKVYFLEDKLFFKDKRYSLNFHKQKIAFHRASMQKFRDDYFGNATYFSYQDCLDYESIFDQFLKDGIKELHMYRLADFVLEKRLKNKSETYKIPIIFHDSPGFICSEEEIQKVFKDKKKYFQTSFYRYQREKLNILINPDGSYVGGKLTYDSENRKKLPKNLVPPKILTFETSSYKESAIEYAKKVFKKNPGQLDNFIYAIDHKEAKAALYQFFEERLDLFGPYEDAIHSDYNFVFHSTLSPYLNVGLLTPNQVIRELLKFIEGKNINLSSIEGFIRQIIGWREFMHGVYRAKGVEIRNSNFFNSENKLPKAFYDGTTGIPPVDNAIKNLNKYAYNHHIERLMLLGNFMCLLEIDPNQIYNWFMEMYIDSYDWVMVPNVYSMSQFADGGLITTKPYVSSSNYVLKMSNYKKGNWCEIWDALYWRFIKKHKGFFQTNPRLNMMVRLLEKMDPAKLENHEKLAEEYLEKILKS